MKAQRRKKRQPKMRSVRKPIHQPVEQASKAEAEQLALLDDSALGVQTALHLDGKLPFDYAGVAAAEALDARRTESGEMGKKGEAVSKLSKRKRDRLKQRVGEREKWREPIEQSKRMRQWVLDAEHILDGSWAPVEELGGTGEQDMRNAGLTKKDVGLRFDSWRLEFTQKLTAGVLKQTERECLEQFLQVLDNLRPHLIQCYDLSCFPRTNNETEGSIRRTKARSRRISGRKNWNHYLLRFGRSLAFDEWWEADPHRWQQFEKMAPQVSPDRWRPMRKETTSAQSEQLKRFRFRHKPATYLATLEDRWAAAAQSSLLP